MNPRIRYVGSNICSGGCGCFVEYWWRYWDGSGWYLSSGSYGGIEIEMVLGGEEIGEVET